MNTESTFKVPESEIGLRIKRLQEELHKAEINSLLLFQRVDLFYFSGTAQNGYLYIPADGKPLLLIKKYMPRAQKESSIQDIVEISSVKELPIRISDFYGGLPYTLGLEFDVIPVKDFIFYRKLFSKQKCVDGSELIHRVRMIKSGWEIAQIEKTAGLSHSTFKYIAANISPGYTEIEFAGMFETFARRMGHGAKLRIRDHQAEMNTWHILSGCNGGMLGSLDSPSSGEGPSIAFPSGAGRKKLAANEPILIDLGSVMNGYHFDETRMFAIEQMPKDALYACQAAIEIHNEVLEDARPGVTFKELFDLSVSKAEELGYGDSYLGPPGYKTGFIGHGIGLELVEKPFIAYNNKSCLEPGMVFALEPKIVFENQFAAGIESVFLVTKTGNRLLSQTPVTVFVC